MDAYERASRGRTLKALVLVGSADKFDLRREARARFGSNAGLARARAEWVDAQMALPSSPLANVTRIILTTGQGTFGTVTPEQTAEDRSVTLYAIWEEPFRRQLSGSNEPSQSQTKR